jgi:protein TonB
MLDHLVASAPTRGWSVPGTLMSVAFHAGLTYLAVHLTLGTGVAGPTRAMDTTLVFVSPQAEERSTPAPEVRLGEMPTAFRTLVAPVSIPTDIPPVDLRETFDPRDYRGVGQELPLELGVGPGAAAEPGMTYAEAAVDEKPEILSSPPLQYPDVLRQAGIEGYVLVEAIIDVSGRAEPGSLRVVQSTHVAFDRAAMEVVAKSVYRPGRMRGELVRVLVNVPVSFSLRKPVA